MKHIFSQLPAVSAFRATVLAGALAGVTALSLVACSTTEDSRSLANPKTSVLATAQQVCSTCHGMDGNATSPNFPSLAGQQKDYLISELKEFREHRRHNEMGTEYMWGITRSLTDQQIEGLADFYQRQVPRVMGQGSASQIAAGKVIFEEGIPAKNVIQCKACHGDHGQGMALFPRIASQHADYIVRQLKIFQLHNSDRDGAEVMKPIAEGMTDQNMKDVAVYLQSLAQP